MCIHTDAELVACLDLSVHGKRLRVREYVTNGIPLMLEDLHDAEVIRLLGCYEIDPMTAAIQNHPGTWVICS